MQVILKVELHTEVPISSNRGSIKMFSKTIIISEISSANFISLLEDGYLQVEGWVLRPKNFIAVEGKSSTVQSCVCTHISRRQDDLDYYKQLICENWMPNIECVKAIQSDGYPNFQPNKF
jgi:hypothetical protein